MMYDAEDLVKHRLYLILFPRVGVSGSFYKLSKTIETGAVA